MQRNWTGPVRGHTTIELHRVQQWMWSLRIREGHQPRHHSLRPFDPSRYVPLWTTKQFTQPFPTMMTSIHVASSTCVQAWTYGSSQAQWHGAVELQGPSHICTMYARDALAAGGRIFWGTLSLQILHPLSMFTHALWYICLASVYAKVIGCLVNGSAFQLLIFQLQCRIYNNHIKCFSNKA